MSLTNDPARELDAPVVAQHTAAASSAADPLLPPPVATSAATGPTVVPSPASDESSSTKDHRGGKVKAAGLIAAATALAGKLRTEVPKKVVDVREKRAVGQHVVMTELRGRVVAVGPYRNSSEAQAVTRRMAGTPTAVELVSERAFFSTSGEAT
jgi:hypothetical protein